MHSIHPLLFPIINFALQLLVYWLCRKKMAASNTLAYKMAKLMIFGQFITGAGSIIMLIVGAGVVDHVTAIGYLASAVLSIFFSYYWARRFMAMLKSQRTTV